MIISRTPFRVSFFGGGTDFPAWYKENGGAVLSTSIDKYCYVNARELPPFFDYKYRIRYAKNENTTSIADIEHPSVRECLNYLNIDHGVEIQHTADLPAMSGLGSSSTFTVGLLHALYGLKNRPVTRMQLARDAITVEQDRIGESVGSQDQVAAAFGGFNKIEFAGQHEIKVSPLAINPDRVAELERHLMLFFSGFSRHASEIEAKKLKNITQKGAELKRMRGMVDGAIDILKSTGKLDDFGRLLSEAWKIKRDFATGVTNTAIDDLYEVGLRSGAIGGKLLGAGAGGFILFFVKPELQPVVKAKLSSFMHVPFKFDKLGSQIIYRA